MPARRAAATSTAARIETEKAKPRENRREKATMTFCYHTARVKSKRLPAEVRELANARDPGETSLAMVSNAGIPAAARGADAWPSNAAPRRIVYKG